MSYQQLLYSALLTGLLITWVADASNCNFSQTTFNPERFCNQKDLTGDLLMCAEVARKELSPLAAAGVLSSCRESNETCLRREVEYIIEYQLHDYYTEVLNYLLGIDFDKESWVSNAIATIYIFRAEEDDLLEAEQILKPLQEAGYRTAIGNMASLRHSQKRYSESIMLLESLKENEELFYGDALHVVQYAQHYHFGNGVEKSLSTAKMLYEKVIGKLDNGVLEHLLADIYLEEGELTRGMELLHDSMNQGLYKSADMLASFYLVGVHVEKNYEIAMKYLKVAARLGSPTALANQGIIYNQLGEVNKARIALISAALVNNNATAKRILQASKIEPEKYRCKVAELFASPDNFLLK